MRPLDDSKRSLRVGLMCAGAGVSDPGDKFHRIGGALPESFLDAHREVLDYASFECLSVRTSELFPT